MARKDFHKVVIGRSDVVTFVDFAHERIPAKIDTGAYHSAVHASNITVTDDGKKLTFTLLGEHPVFKSLAQKVETDSFKQVEIKNSFGHTTTRYEVKLRVKIGPKVFRAYFTLADRSELIYPLLLGRKLLNDRFLVDTSQSQVERTELKQKYSIDVPADEEALVALGELE